MEINDGVNYSQASRDLSGKTPSFPQKQQLNKDLSDFSYPSITVLAFRFAIAVYAKPRLVEHPQLDDWALPKP